MKTDERLGRTDTGSSTPSPFDVIASPDRLLPLALSQPMVAHREATLVLLESTSSSTDRSIAHQALAIVERDGGHLESALANLRRALRLARRTSDARVADVLATYGLTLVHAGRTDEGLRRFEEAVPLTPPEALARLKLRQAQALYIVGRYPESVEVLDDAIRSSHQLGDRLWEARGLNNRCVALLAMGEIAAAAKDAELAERLFEGLSQQLESAHSVHNRALAMHQRGSLPEALELMDAVTARYAELDATPADLVIDHAQMLLTAGLVSEAREMTAAALGSSHLQSVKRAEILLTAAQAALADGDIDAAEVDGDLAGRLFAAQQRPAWSHRARLLSLQAQYLADHPDLLDLTIGPEQPGSRSADARRRQERLLRTSAELVEQMRAERAAELPVAQLLHGRLARDAGHDEEAERSFAAAARSRHTGSGLAQAAGWLADALLAEVHGNRRTLLHACRRGLDSVDEYRVLLGDLELRALATRHGNEFMTLALRSARERRDARATLWWVERWRATALAVPRARSEPDDEVDHQIAALRDVTRRLDSAAGSAPDALRHERDRLEADIRRTQRRRRGDGRRAVGFDPERIHEELGDTVLLSLVALDGELSAVTVADGRVRHSSVGPLDEALREARFARFALRRTAFGRTADIDATAARLQTALLGRPRPEWSRRKVLVVPPSVLLTAPYGTLPVFADTLLTVTPSATLWSVARRQDRLQGHIALVTGPDLSSGENEVTALSPLHERARAIGGAGATVAGALEVLDAARLAHIAAHGTFRADAPMFSSLRLYDGPLTIHDLDRLDRPPAEMVLSACDSGNAAPIGAHEALGLVSSLLAMGTSSVLASVVPVNDQATVAVMRNVHQVVGRGGSLAEGWLAARQAAADPLERATAGAFTVWGA